MIRLYKPEDKTELIDLVRINTPHFFDPSEEIDFNNYLDNQLEDYYVVEQENKIVGCGGINYENEFKTAVISWDIIHPDLQGKGIGKQLLLHRINKIKRNKFVSQIKVRTAQFTYKFYEKSGFILHRIEKDYWAPGFDLYYMTIDLTLRNTKYKTY